MKKLFLLLIVASAFIACEDIEDNSPALQAEIDNVFYKALDSRGILADDGSLAIYGPSSDRNITLFLSVFQGGTFELNSGNGHQAIYEDPSGEIYSTEFGGGGVVNITDRRTENGNEILSGDFTFEAILPGVETVVVSKGVMFKVPLTSGVIEEPIDPDEPNPDGGFVAKIDGDLFDPSTVAVNTNATSIIINAALVDDTIQLVIPLDAEPAMYDILSGGFDAVYFIQGEEETANEGVIRIFDHNMSERNISGTFAFITANHVISQGQFNIDY